MANPVTLKTNDTQEVLYPVTLLTAVQDENGNSVDQLTLLKNNSNAYTPTGDYNPATKKYVDDNSGGTVIALQSAQPSGQSAGDFWYQIT